MKKAVHDQAFLFADSDGEVARGNGQETCRWETRAARTKAVRTDAPRCEQIAWNRRSCSLGEVSRQLGGLGSASRQATRARVPAIDHFVTIQHLSQADVSK